MQLNSKEGVQCKGRSTVILVNDTVARSRYFNGKQAYMQCVILQPTNCLCDSCDMHNTNLRNFWLRAIEFSHSGSLKRCSPL